MLSVPLRPLVDRLTVAMFAITGLVVVACSSPPDDVGAPEPAPRLEIVDPELGLRLEIAPSQFTLVAEDAVGLALETTDKNVVLGTNDADAPLNGTDQDDVIEHRGGSDDIDYYVADSNQDPYLYGGYYGHRGYGYYGGPWGYGGNPHYYGGGYRPAYGGWGYVVPQNAPHPDEAWQLVKWLTAEMDGACWFLQQQARPSPMIACNEDPASGDGFRANVGWFNPGDSTVRTTFRAWDTDGTFLGDVRRPAPAGAQRQRHANHCRPYNTAQAAPAHFTWPGLNHLAADGRKRVAFQGLDGFAHCSPRANETLDTGPLQDLGGLGAHLAGDQDIGSGVRNHLGGFDAGALGQAELG